MAYTFGSQSQIDSQEITTQSLGQMYDEALQIVLGEGLTDLHCHVPDPQFTDHFLYNSKYVIAYHYLYGEVLSSLNMTDAQLKAFWALSLDDQVEFLIKHSFDDNTFVSSEGRVGILAAAHELGINTADGDIRRIIREWDSLIADMGRDAYINHVFQRAHLKAVIGTQSVLDPSETELMVRDQIIENWDPRFHCGLRLDEAIHSRVSNDRGRQDSLLRAYNMAGFESAFGDIRLPYVIGENRKLVNYWIKRLPNVRYAAVSLSPDTDFRNHDSIPMQFLEQVMIPCCIEHQLPVVLMPFVKRGIRPLHRNAGDCVASGDTDGLVDFIGKYVGQATFFVTPLHDNDNYTLSMATRALGNLRIWGHWWCNLNPETIERQLRYRLQNNGSVHFGVNTDSRVLEQFIPKLIGYFRIQRKVFIDMALEEYERTRVIPTVERFANKIRQLQDADALLNLAKPRQLEIGGQMVS